MATPSCVIGLDQGSTSSRAVLYDRRGRILHIARAPLESLVPAPDRAEHDPADLFEGPRRTLLATMKSLGKGGERRIAAIGIANQRSTFLLWDRRTGRPLNRAVSWQDRRGAESVEEFERYGEMIRRKTGLRLNAHSTVGKLRWLLHHVKDATRKARGGDVLFGTVNTYLIWRLTGGKVHATDHVNASRTVMMNLATRRWDPELLALFEIPPAILPEILPTSAWYGEAAIGRASVPILASIGDQQASLCGQGGFQRGHLALTYGTGGFLLWNIGDRPQKRTALLSTLAWSSRETARYALEGTVNAAGSAILWLKRLGLIDRLEDIDELCRASRDEVFFIPAISGLGSPYYKPVETTLFGLKRTTTRADLVRGLVAGIAYLMKDNYDRMVQERGAPPRVITAGGGAAQSRWLLQFQADLFGKEIGLSGAAEPASRGAAYLAGLQCGFWPSPESLAHLNRLSERFRPKLPPGEAREKHARWRHALDFALRWGRSEMKP